MRNDAYVHADGGVADSSFSLLLERWFAGLMGKVTGSLECAVYYVSQFRGLDYWMIWLVGLCMSLNIWFEGL